MDVLDENVVAVAQNEDDMYKIDENVAAVSKETDNTTTAPPNEGEEGVNKYEKIENILRQIDDESERYLNNFKKEKMDDKAVFEQQLFVQNDKIWSELMPEKAVMKRFLRVASICAD